jgi:methyl-accepting chemotaxis protein
VKNIGGAVSIRSKMLLAYTVVLALIAGVGFYAVSKLAEAGNLAVQLYDGPLQAVNHLRMAYTKFDQASTAVERRLSNPGKPLRVSLASILVLVDDLLEDIKIVQERAGDPKVIAAVRKAEKLILDWHEASQPFLRASQGGAVEPSTLSTLAKAADEALSAIDIAAESAAAYGFDFRLAAEKAANDFGFTAIVLAITVGVLGLLLSVAFSFSLCLPIRRAIAVAARVANGDFSDVITSRRRDEVGELLRSLAHMQASLRAAEDAKNGASTGEGPLTYRT